MVLETVVLAPAEQQARSERTVCRSCWIETTNDDGESSNVERAPWPCEVVRTRREFVGYLRWRQCDRHAEQTINDAVTASRDALPWVGQKCERCTEDDLAAMIAGNPEATRLASQLKASSYRNLSTVLENARLRERVAALENQAEQSDWRVLKLTDALADLVLLIHETRHDGTPVGCAERICEIGKQLVQAARDSVVDNLADALTQADEAGGGAG